jgi:hypothetical protein
MHCRKCTGNSKTDDPDIFEDAYYSDLKREQYKDLLFLRAAGNGTGGSQLEIGCKSVGNQLDKKPWNNNQNYYIKTSFYSFLKNDPG